MLVPQQFDWSRIPGNRNGGLRRVRAGTRKGVPVAWPGPVPSGTPWGYLNILLQSCPTNRWKKGAFIHQSPYPSDKGCPVGVIGTSRCWGVPACPQAMHQSNLGAESKRYSGQLRAHLSTYTCRELQAIAGVKSVLRGYDAGPNTCLMQLRIFWIWDFYMLP